MTTSIRTKLEESNEGNLNKLVKALDMLSVLEKRHQDLLKEYESLAEKYLYTKKCTIDAVWRYIPMKSSDFVHFPHLNKEVIEGNLRVEDYSLEKKIGEGQHSVVKLGAVGSGEKYAVKIIAKDRIRSVDGLLRLEKEINALVTLNPHPNIVNFKEAIHAETSLYLVMEHLPMDMFTFMDNFKADLDDNIASVILSELLTGLEHMASKRVTHRDLKPENVLIDLTPRSIRVKICDFGLARVIPEGTFHVSDFCGSPGFFAPEVYLDKSYDPIKADLFSIGCIALELLLSQKYFKERWISVYAYAKQRRETDFLNSIKKAIETCNKEMKRLYHSEIGNCVDAMIQFYPGLRAAPYQILNKAWISECNVLDAVAKLNGNACAPPAFGKLKSSKLPIGNYAKSCKLSVVNPDTSNQITLKQEGRSANDQGARTMKFQSTMQSVNPFSCTVEKESQDMIAALMPNAANAIAETDIERPLHSTTVGHKTNNNPDEEKSDSSKTKKIAHTTVTPFGASQSTKTPLKVTSNRMAKINAYYALPKVKLQRSK